MEQHERDAKSLEPYDYLTKAPGKEFRNLFMDSLNDKLQIDPKVLDTLKQVVSMLHNASLLIDDIEDESATRRGAPTAHQVFGVPRTLNAGNYVYFLAMEQLLGLPQSEQCLKVFTREMCNLHRGQGREIWWRDTQHVPTLGEYEAMVIDKTGGLFRLALQLMEAHSLHTVGCQVVDRLALYFQIRDDVINLASPTYHKLKGYCEDITEGKLSFVVLTAMHSLEPRSSQDLLTVLQSKPTDKREIDKAMRLIRDSGAIARALQYLAALERELVGFSSSPTLANLMRQLSSELLECS
ncbi:hypothetical protein BASA81_001810 [Batrachochytrium salamandrivorans]|nr:hypothetical protein BASA81_001810 [Batrachochytrium salamandrivorans]